MKLQKLVITSLLIVGCTAGCQSKNEEAEKAIKQANETAAKVQEETAKAMEQANKAMADSMAKSNEMMDAAKKQMEAAGAPAAAPETK